MLTLYLDSSELSLVQNNSFNAGKVNNNNKERVNSRWFLGYLLTQHQFKKMAVVSKTFGPSLSQVVDALGMLTLLPLCTICVHLRYVSRVVPWFLE